MRWRNQPVFCLVTVQQGLFKIIWVKSAHYYAGNLFDALSAGLEDDVWSCACVVS